MWVLTREQAPAHRFLLRQVRQQGETPVSQLWRKFVDRVFSRSWTGLWKTRQLKVLYYNLRHAGVLSTLIQLRTGVSLQGKEAQFETESSQRCSPARGQILRTPRRYEPSTAVAATRQNDRSSRTAHPSLQLVY
jgi:hypothetical protein